MGIADINEANLKQMIWHTLYTIVFLTFFTLPFYSAPTVVYLWFSNDEDYTWSHRLHTVHRLFFSLSK
jgi:hypothetical protein